MLARLLPLLLVVTTGCLALAGHSGPWACSTSSDCSGGNVCRSLAGSSGLMCVAPNACNYESDCPQNTGLYWSCSGGTCTPPTCSDDSDCSGYACSNGTCTAPCNGNDQCASGYECSGQACIPKPCQSDSDCAPYKCESGSCASVCESDADCSSGNLCDVSGMCGPRACTTGSTGQCDGYACVGGTCLSSCTQDSDCDSAHGCNAGVCMQCTGTAMGCAQQSGCNVPGCSNAGSCGGGDIDCQIFDDEQTSCEQIPGCAYDTTDDACTGGSNCGNLDQAACLVASVACNYSSGCGGTPTPCGQLSVNQCSAVAGCSLM